MALGNLSGLAGLGNGLYPPDYYPPGAWQQRNMTDALRTMQEMALMRAQITTTTGTGSITVNNTITSKPRPKSFRQELQAEVDEWLPKL